MRTRTNRDRSTKWSPLSLHQGGVSLHRFRWLATRLDPAYATCIQVTASTRPDNMSTSLTKEVCPGTCCRIPLNTARNCQFYTWNARASTPARQQASGTLYGKPVQDLTWRERCPVTSLTPRVAFRSSTAAFWTADSAHRVNGLKYHR